MDSRWQQPTTQEKTVLVKNLLIPLAKKIKENAYAFKCALKKEMFEDFKYVQSLEKEVDELQLDKNELSNEYDLLLQECKPTTFSESLERKNFSNTNSITKTNVLEGLIHKHSVSWPQLRSNQMKDKVMQNNSQVKIQLKEVEDHHRNFSISNKTKSVTACNDSLNSKTLNVNDVRVTCGKCVFNSNHDACVSKFLNDMNARSNKPQEVSIRTRKSIRNTNQSVATYPRITVASEIHYPKNQKLL
ncbi:hypothetical protein Tco_0820505 [Tanacetum coccineum]|uniref:Uncharacterized protein n=1 Tax=Tanacetum coccineum TaxID=301880 RepID=A0ABQ5AAI3_9ASTR